MLTAYLGFSNIIAMFVIIGLWGTNTFLRLRNKSLEESLEEKICDGNCKSYIPETRDSEADCKKGWCCSRAWQKDECEPKIAND